MPSIASASKRHVHFRVPVDPRARDKRKDFQIAGVQVASWPASRSAVVNPITYPACVRAPMFAQAASEWQHKCN